MKDFLTIVALIAFFAWPSFNITRAYMQRMEMIDRIGAETMSHVRHEDFWKLFNESWERFDRVPYLKHIWYLTTFRDPSRLYEN